MIAQIASAPIASRHPRFRWRWAVALAVPLALASLVVSALSGGPGGPRVAHAATAPASYGHGWLMADDVPSIAGAYGYGDARWDNAHCGYNGQLRYGILDFGQIGTAGNAYGVYAYWHWPSASSFVVDGTVEAVAEAYADAWYNGTTNCPRLRLVLAFNTYQECPLAWCDAWEWGYDWGSVVYAVQDHLNTRGEGWQVTVQGGCDCRTEWDGPSTPLTVLHGYSTFVSYMASHPELLDLGDANFNSAWSVAAVAEMAWMGGYAEPYPYIANQWAANNWRTVQNYVGTGGGFHFDGVRTECNVGDPVTWCPNGNATPTQAWSDLSVASGNNLWPYATNVRTE